MGQPLSLSLRLADEAATTALGAAAARCLPAAAQPFVVELAGDLGAGKTTFARGLLRELGVSGQIRSPSYALLETYEAGGWQVLHLDLYRLLDPEELENLGVRDYHDGRCLWLVEWPGKGEGYLPRADARLEFASGATEHTVTLTAEGAAGAAWIAALKPDQDS